MAHRVSANLFPLLGVPPALGRCLAPEESAAREALLSHRSRVMRLVALDAAAMALTGGALGLAAALACSRVLQRLLFGVRAADPLVLAGAVLVAAYLPARRAARVDPNTALRIE